MVSRIAALALGTAALAACQPPRAPSMPTVGLIAGVARDHDSGEAIAQAVVVARPDGDLRAIERRTDRQGKYSFEALPPGRYDVTASFAGHGVHAEHVEVRAGHRAIVDLSFLLGHDEIVQFEYSDAKLGAIDHYRPRGMSPAASAIEGTISDLGSHERVPGAVITAFVGEGDDTVQTVSDDDGRYRFDGLAPGTYVVSASYAIGGHGRIELRRSDVVVGAGEAAIVPLWVELTPASR